MEEAGIRVETAIFMGMALVGVALLVISFLAFINIFAEIIILIPCNKI